MDFVKAGGLLSLSVPYYCKLSAVNSEIELKIKALWPTPSWNRSISWTVKNGRNELDSLDSIANFGVKGQHPLQFLPKVLPWPEPSADI